MEKNTVNFIKYCLGYIKLTRASMSAGLNDSVKLPRHHFSISGLLNGEEDGNISELINLKNFYGFDPNAVPKEILDEYDKEKILAKKIEDIYNRYRDDQFTKQVVLNFGYFEIEIPINKNVIESEEENEVHPSSQTKIVRYPLFSLPVIIKKEITESGIGQYFIYSVDTELQVNVGILESVIGEDLYFQLLNEIGNYELAGRFELPIIKLDIFTEIWRKVKAQLRLTAANFDENSFSLEAIEISLNVRANYFLADDLSKLAKLPEEDLSATSLTSWTQNDELNIQGDLPHEQDLFFPFLYDKYQLSTLSLLGNKASIIQGPPGTGKSETIANLLCQLVATNKRVLFVSQKAQALKVVKDKLKKLDVKYLFGYLPNPSSSQIGEKDEADGIAPQLSALGAYIEKIEDTGQRRSLASIAEEKEEIRNLLNKSIAKQKEYFNLHQELLLLKEYDIIFEDFDLFVERFSRSEWQEIKLLLSKIKELNEIIDKYSPSDKKEEFDDILSAIDLRSQFFAAAVGKIKDDVARTGYDRYSNLWRNINNYYRNLRLGFVRNKLPREILDYIDKILMSNVSRREVLKLLEPLHKHCCHYANIQHLAKLEEKLKQNFGSCGISYEAFKVIDEKINDSSFGFDEMRIKILRVQEIRDKLQKLTKMEMPSNISQKLRTIERERIKQVDLYIQNIINSSLLCKWKESVKIKQVVRKFASVFGKSKKAFKTFDNLRKDSDSFNSILELIPIWIMELDDASRIIPLQAGIFDYVILDEASQCNVAYALPVMYRAKRVLFVGDSEQMRDSTVMFKSNSDFDELAYRYKIPEEKQIKRTGAAAQSVLDIAYKRGFMEKTLHYHYRSPAELIGFSNKYFYRPKGKALIPINSHYLTYKDTNRIMLIHEIKPDWGEEISDLINITEAKGILALFKELRSDERYQNKSIGILSFFNAQASYIRDLLERNGFNEDDNNYKVSIIEGIQGDEKDIVIYSFVMRTPEQKNKYVPLTGEGGDIRAEINQGRVNVAFTRAKVQVHCFISLPLKEIPERIWIKKYLEYIQENGEIATASDDLNPFDSFFEQDFYNSLRAKLQSGYKIRNQVKSCGFKIDFVVNNIQSGKSIAIECDGPCHFKDELDEVYGINVESDEERQRILEAAGWKFFRIKYMDWVDIKTNRDVIIQSIVNLLQ